MKAALSLLGLLLVVCLATARIPGGWEDVDVNDEGVLEAAQHGTEALSKKFSGNYQHRLAKVLKAKRQVVAGLNYQMDLIVGMTTCKKDDAQKECDFQDGVSTFKKCTVIVYKDLKGNHELKSSGCILASKKDM